MKRGLRKKQSIFATGNGVTSDEVVDKQKRELENRIVGHKEKSYKYINME